MLQEGATSIARGSDQVIIPLGDRLNSLWIELTNRCNLQCKHCYSNSSPYSGTDDALDLRLCKRILEQAIELGCASVQFIGGEPTLSKFLIDLLVHSRNVGFDNVEVFSNLIHLDEELIETALAKGIEFSTSFYSPHPMTHAEITGKRDSFECTVGNIKRLVSRGVPLRCNIVVFDDAQDAAEAQEFLRSIGVTRIALDRFRKIGRGECVGRNDRDAMSELCGECWKGRLCVSSHGDVYTCIMARNWPLGNVLRSSLKEIFCSDSAGQVRKAIANHFVSEGAIGQCLPQACGPHELCGPRQACGPQQPCGPYQVCGPHQPGPCLPRGG
jgi:MoaA/NifB/PqqE/SkfB family radical SAM enzyme